MKCNQSRPGFELVSPCPFPTTITITPRAPPKISIYDQQSVNRSVHSSLGFSKVLNPGSHASIAKYIIFTNPSARAGYDTRSIFKRSLTGLNSEFSFSQTSCLTKAEEFSLPYYLPIAGGRIIGFIPFPRVLVLCEMQSVSSRFWTRVAVSISCDDNHYTTGTSIAKYILTSRLYNTKRR